MATTELFDDLLKRKQITNADRIRNMSDEELAEFVEGTKEIDDIGFHATYMLTEFEWVKKGDMLKWLQSEAKKSEE